MMHRLLPVFLLAIPFCSSARGDLSTTDTAEAPVIIYMPEKLTQPTGIRLPAATYGNHGGRRVAGFYGLEFGYVSSKLATDSTHAKYSGLSIKVDLGVTIVMKDDDRKTNLLSVGIAAERSGMLKYDFGILSLPINYTSIGYGRGGSSTGFFWQLGVNFNDIHDVMKDEANLVSQFNKLMIEPTCSFGLSMPFRLMRRRWHGGSDEVGHGRVNFGPFFSYAVNNMSKEPGVTVHDYSIGLRYTYVFM